MPTAVALDGPAGAGKSSIAKRAAKELGFIYVDTGALYRTIGLAASRAGVEPVDSPEVDALGEIRTPEASMTASKISAIPNVRAYLLDLQRDMAKTNDIIMDGRDIGTVVLPDAQVKIFLIASPEARAGRRYKELIEKGMSVKYEDILSDVIERDYNDTHRKTAPLKAAEDSVTVDTTELDFEQSVNAIISVIKEKI